MRNTSKKQEGKRSKRIAKNAKGITLVALVITIIIIIILATVTIRFAFTDDGIIKRAEQAKDMYANDTAYTDQSMANATAYLDEMLNGVTGGSSDEENPPTPTPPTDGTYSEEEKVNTPQLVSNMKLVVYDENNNTWIEDTTKSAYSYKDTAIAGANSSEWANAEVTVDGITSYFVWIPRYAYKITYYTDENKTTTSSTKTKYGIIDIKFIKGTGKETVDGTPCKYASENPTAEDYIVHPAFTDEEENGGWDSQLPGIWIGKYEVSLANKANESNIVTNDTGTGNILLSEHTDKTIVTKPGYSSWRYITIGNSYTNALAYDTNLNSHMLKNSEWGAVAYLTESKYGRNGTEIGINDNGYITGGGAETDAIETNADQSTTGNVYGIYDLRGGANERVASYYNGSDVNTTNLNNGSSFASVNGESTKYATAYTGTNASTAYKYGDATYETSGWHSDNAVFVYSNLPFFLRGGLYSHVASGTGVFYYFYYGGGADADNSFRLALVL